MADYYVDIDAADDLGVGSIGDPFKYINSHINALGAGDNMYVRGDVGSAKVHLEDAEINITVDGSNGSPITITPYSNEQVEIRKAGYGEIFDIDGDYIVIAGKDQLEVNKNGDAGYAMRVDGAHDIIQDCEVYDIDGAGSGALIYCGSASSYALIDGCVVHDAYKEADTDAHGITLSGSSFSVIQNCTVYDCHGDQIYVHDSDAIEGYSILDNVLYSTLANCSENGIDAKRNDSAVNRATIAGNTIYGIYSCTGDCGGSGDPNGEAISCNNDANYIDLYDNIIYDCTSGISANDGATGIVIRDNLIYDLHTDVEDGNTADWAMGAFFFNNAVGVELYNNTVHNAPEHYITLHGSLGSLTLKNNIFNDCGTLHDPDTLVGGVTADYNCWQNCTDTIAGGNDVNADPLFADEGSDDFRLTGGSPALLAADATVGLGNDMGYWQSIAELRRRRGY